MTKNNSTKIDSLGTVTEIKHYGENFRKIYIKNTKNKSNYYTIIKEAKIDDKYITLSKLEIGEKYITYFLFEDSILKLERRFNKIKKTVYKKELFISNGCGQLYIDEYMSEKNINFNLTNLTNGKKRK